MLEARERDENRSRAGRLAADYDRDVAGSILEQREDARVFEQALGGIDEDEVDILLAGEPRVIAARGHGRERAHPNDQLFLLPGARSDPSAGR